METALASTWLDFTDAFDYEKSFYDVLLPSGEIVHHCWPNAGKMNALQGDCRKWSGRDGIKVRLSTMHPMDEDAGFKFQADQITRQWVHTAADLERLEKARLKRERKERVKDAMRA